jgi:glutamyl-tRNA reductase
MYAYHYQMNQRPLPSEGTLASDSQAEMEATIASLKLHFETVRQREVKRVRGRLGALSSMQESAIESLTQSIIDQILRAPLSVLQAVSEGSDSLAVIETVLCIFDLDPSPGPV